MRFNACLRIGANENGNFVMMGNRIKLFVRAGWVWVVLLAAGCATGSADPASGTKNRAPRPSPQESAPKPLPDGPRVQIDSTPAAKRSADSEPADADPAGADAAPLSGEQIDSLVRKGPSYPLKQVTVKPARRDGTFRGFEIVDITDTAAQVVSPKLQSGDVITHINGVRIEKPGDYLEAWKMLGSLARVRIDLVRAGTLKHVVWSVQ